MRRGWFKYTNGLNGDVISLRPRFIVIQSTSADSKKARQFRIAPEGTNAGAKFSAQECDVTNVSRKEAILLHRSDQPQSLIKRQETSKIISTSDFAHKIIIRLSTNKCDLFALIKKKRSVCNLPNTKPNLRQSNSPLPRGHIRHKAVARQRRAQYLKNANGQMKEYLKSHANNFINGEKEPYSNKTTTHQIRR
ncbi:unnamed protein product [Clonostachys rhizophaga]|uniref:Uncharacterized protein n=1 Tax=Clonostachys rhizophaga TaxID=160324 RepID=A0A9N9VRI3_9HYPO|nr:unnamed protein product [Clonostachys rhizophaga]